MDDERRKKLRIRAWRRGFRELDMIMGAFADRRIAAMTHAELDDFERFLDAPDQDVYAWIIGETPPPLFDTPLLTALRTFQFSEETKSP